MRMKAYVGEGGVSPKAYVLFRLYIGEKLSCKMDFFSEGGWPNTYVLTGGGGQPNAYACVRERGEGGKKVVITYNLPASPYINKTICPPKVVLHTLMEESTRQCDGQIVSLVYGERGVFTIHP